MTDKTTTAAESKTATVLEDMDSRKLFATTADAAAYLERCANDFADFGSYPVVTVGFTDEGDFDPAVYTESMQITVAKLTEKGSAKEGRESQVRAIVIYPTPTLAALMQDSAAQDWLAGLIAKESNLVAMRPLRKATTPAEMVEAANAMPRTVAEYITSNRETSSGLLETYNSLWQLIRKALGEKFRQFALANLSKKEMRKAMESASYAATVYPHLETRQNKKGERESYFELAARLGIALATKEGMDPAIFARMLETRNEREIEVADDEDAEDFDLEAMAAAIATKDQPADSQPAEEGTTSE